MWRALRTRRAPRTPERSNLQKNQFPNTGSLLVTVTVSWSRGGVIGGKGERHHQVLGALKNKKTSPKKYKQEESPGIVDGDFAGMGITASHPNFAKSGPCAALHLPLAHSDLAAIHVDRHSAPWLYGRLAGWWGPRHCDIAAQPWMMGVEKHRLRWSMEGMLQLSGQRKAVVRHILQTTHF